MTSNLMIFLKYFSITLLIAGGAGLAWLSMSSIYQNRQRLSQDLSAAISSKPEAFTELYFEDNENLPNKITNDAQFAHNYPTLALFTFKFTVHNMENKDMNYSYDVYQIENGIKTHIDIGKILIKKNESKTITESFSAPKIYPKTEVVVALPEKSEQISFWMEIKQ